MEQSELAVSLLGGLRIEKDGQTVTGFASRKAEALFVYLACAERPIPRETAATLFWPESDQRRALANLSVLLTSLRKQLADYLHTDRHTLAFAAERDYFLDSAAFAEAVQAARQAQPETGRLTRSVAAQLATAVSLYKGDFLAGFSISNAPDFEAWVLLEQERLRQLAVAALSDLVDFHTQRGQYGRGIEYGRQLVALDPLQEAAHRQLMLLYALDDQRPQALAQYEQCARILADELSVAPDDETTALYEALKNDRVTGGSGDKVKGKFANVTLSPATEGSPHSLTPTPHHNLSAATTSFVGREAELARIDNWLADVNGRLLTIVGPGGIGKSRLAQEAARAHLGEFTDGVWFVSLVSLPADGDVVTAVANAIGFTFTGAKAPETQLVNALSGKEMLLILDNFEHLLGDQAISLVTALLQQAAELKLIVTSRERLNLRAETLLTLWGLPYPGSVFSHQYSVASEPDTDDRLPTTGYAAVQLFVQQARRLRSDFELVGNESELIRLCNLVEGLPLALELAATWTRVLSVAEVVAEIQSGLDFLTTAVHDMPARHRSLRAVFAYSWNLLTPQEQTVYRRLAVCRGGFTRAAAQAIAGASLPVLAGLVDKSFMRLDQEAGTQNARYRRHPLLLQFAAEKLAEDDALQAKSEEKHARYYTAVLANIRSDFHSHNRLQALTTMAAERENVHSAWRWALENDLSLLDGLMSSYCHYLVDTGLFEEGLTQMRLATSRLRAADRPVLLARAQTQQCLFERLAGYSDKGRELVLDSLAILDRVNDRGDTRQYEARALLQYGGYLLSDAGDYAESEEINNEALVLFRELDQLPGQGRALFNLSASAYYTGRYEEATQLAQNSLALHKRAGDQIGQMQAQQVLGLIKVSQGQFDQGAQLFRNCIDLAQAARYKAELPWHYADLGYAYLLAGRFDEATDTFQQSLAYSLEQGDPQAISVAYTLSGLAHMHNGRFPEAQEAGLSGVHYAEGPDFPFQLGFAYHLLGALALAQKKARLANEHLGKSVKLFRQINHLEYLAWSLPVQLVAACTLKRWRKAKQLAQETADLSVSLNAYAPNVLALLGLVCWQYYRGDPEWAVSLWSRACSEPFVAHSQWIRLALPDVWPNANPDSERLSKPKSNQPPISTLIKKAVAEIQMSQ